MYLPVILAILVIASALYLVHQFVSRELEPGDHASSPAQAEDAALEPRKAA